VSTTRSDYRRITPCRLENAGGTLLDLISDIRAAAARLGDRLHPKTAADLADRVRIMNSYYSNLIEGRFTRPREIERAMKSAPGINFPIPCR
jgi:Fic family protein